MHKRSGIALVTAGVAAIGTGFSIRHTAIRPPDLVETAFGGLALTYALIKIVNDSFSAVRYFTGVTNDDYYRLKGREQGLEFIGLGLLILIALMHSAGMRVAALAAIGIILIAVGISDLRGRDPFDPWLSRGFFVAIGGFAVTFMALGLRLALQNTGPEVSEHYEYVLGGFLILSFLLNHYLDQ